ncbi:hypothetical protein CCO48_02355 [Salmonella enterica subsp. enterica serovar Altendorf]|uniref:hypothetical protein n=1 Tax=Salmonella enterica TaxID=28901 RepID=UPI000BA17C08|nr:hypothetical protein [Salmonella enterica]EBY3805792.1 hypothetical protein [Salmonella enterica subsp. enterica serovar Adabraka]EED8424413.1 hypothetical protein [Salmonella enterica subsp. enterica serovar Losangeles]OZU14456.1 hypothetical protein CCO48_02355 [Salmonella enterica subsp. enterica serovar Altendorf]
MNNTKFDNTKNYPFLATCIELQQRCSKLTAMDVAIYSTMFDDHAFYVHNFGHYTPAHADLAIDCGTTRNTVNASVKKLISFGLVVVVGKEKGAASTYKIVDYRTIENLFDRPTAEEQKKDRRKNAKEKRDAYHESTIQQPEPILDVQKCTPVEEAVEQAVEAVAASLPEEPTTQICVDEPEQKELNMIELSIGDFARYLEANEVPVKKYFNEFFDNGEVFIPELNATIKKQGSVVIHDYEEDRSPW